MERNRLEAFSDGVLAIIITIMVLELSIPDGEGLQDLLNMGPVLISYLVSFLFIAIYWVNHHLIFIQAERINIGILWCNILWLLVMSFIPFFTAWVGYHPNAGFPVAMYFLDMFLACMLFHAMYYLILKENGKRFKLDLRSAVSMVTYFLAAAIGGLNPIVTYVIVSIVSCWWIIPKKGDSETSDD